MLRKTIVGCFGALLLAQAAHADVMSICTTRSGAISCTGTFGASEDAFVETFTLASATDITVQTYGFGGGTNAAGTAISAGGFDPLVVLFSGVATDATVLLDGGGNPIASADTLFGLFSPGCSPAGTVTVGSVPGNCGDDRLSAVLGPGTYTLLHTDASFLPIPVDPGIAGPVDLTDTTSNNYGSSTSNGAYTDLTGGVFQTCVTLTDCNTDAGNFAVDILTSSSGPSPVPEPAALWLLSSAVAVLSRSLWARAASRKPKSRGQKSEAGSLP